MMTRRFLVALTLLNFGLLVFLLGRPGPPAAQGAPSVLRGSALEIVDDQGRVRASIVIHPAGTANGQAYVETVILRLIDPNGHPSVKLAGSERAAGLSLVGESDATHVILKAEGASPSLTLSSGDGRKRVIEP
jgi:hypothetical protein